MGICQKLEYNASVNTFQEKATQWPHKWYITTVVTAWVGTPYALCCWMIPWDVCFFLCVWCDAFTPSSTVPSLAGQSDHCRVSWYMTTHSALPLAENGIHLCLCQSRYHGDRLATLRWWRGSGTALPGGSCVLIWVVKDASGQGEREQETLWENVRERGLPHQWKTLNGIKEHLWGLLSSKCVLVMKCKERLIVHVFTFMFPYPHSRKIFAHVNALIEQFRFHLDFHCISQHPSSINSWRHSCTHPQKHKSMACCRSCQYGSTQLTKRESIFQKSIRSCLYII